MPSLLSPWRQLAGAYDWSSCSKAGPRWTPRAGQGITVVNAILDLSWMAPP